MTPPLTIGLLLAFAGVTVATAVGWATVELLCRHLPAMSSATPSRRATMLAYVRTLPLAMVALVVPAQVMAFVRHESGRAESAGLLLLTLAVIGCALTLEALVRAATSWYGTLRTIERWKRGASPLDHDVWQNRAWTIDVSLPVAVVAGVFRPELFIAEQVVERCTGPELRAIVTHEAAHLRACDNIVKWLFQLTPGSSLFARRTVILEAAWECASEEAADAVASQATSPLLLASALLKVAHLACAQPAESVVASALIGRRSVRARVRRLLEPMPDSPESMRRWLPAALLLAVALTLHLNPVSSLLHEAFELLVRHA